MIATAHPTTPSAAASGHAPASRPLELLEARQARDSLKALLRKEQSAMADFLVALADFDLCRGWEALGHANLFAFIHSELGLSPAPTYWRQEAARLLQRFPDLVALLRRGELCLTTMAELAKVLSAENKEAVLPRFLGISSREAKELVAELQPREAPATRTVVTRVPGVALVSTVGASGSSAVATAEASPTPSAQAALSTPALQPQAPTGAPPSQLWAPKVDFGGVAASVAKRDEVEPLSADRSRIHVNVSRQFTRKLEAARRALGHSIPNATMEQALEVALDLLLEKQAKARGQVKRPQTVVATATSTAPVTPPPALTTHHTVTSSPLPFPRTAPAAIPTEPLTPATPTAASSPTTAERPAPEFAEPRHRRSGPRKHVPAAVFRAVWERDGGRCNWPLDSGGMCGSTHRLELDHVVPWARWGGETADDLRVVCHAHNKLAARQAFGARCVERYVRRRS
jgi:hypothetical protein